MRASGHFQNRRACELVIMHLISGNVTNALKRRESFVSSFITPFSETFLLLYMLESSVVCIREEKVENQHF